MMSTFNQFQGTLIPFNRSNIDTDAILPKQYLKMLDKTGYGDFLFDDERYLDPGDSETAASTRRVNKNFILNITPYTSGTIIVSRKNFGCGSSREHAVWALRDHGIRVVIAESFGAIFFNNSIKNGILPIILGEDSISTLITLAADRPSTIIHVDLIGNTIGFDDQLLTFALQKDHKKSLIEGLDEISETLESASQIQAYEAERLKSEPWVFI